MHVLPSDKEPDKAACMHASPAWTRSSEAEQMKKILVHDLAIDPSCRLNQYLNDLYRQFNQHVKWRAGLVLIGLCRD